MGIYLIRGIFVLIGLCVMLLGIEVHLVAFTAGILVFIYVTLFEGDEICYKDVMGWLVAGIVFMGAGYLTAKAHGISVFELEEHREILIKLRNSFTFGVFCLGMSISEFVALVWVSVSKPEGQ